FIPLMLVSSISFFIVKSYEPYSMETKKLAMEGRIFTHSKEKNILTAMRLDELLQEQYESIAIDKKLKDLIDLIRKSDKNIFAVSDVEGRFAGIIEINDVKEKLFQPEQYENTSVASLVKKPGTVIYRDEHMHEVIEKFDISQSWYLPVLDDEKKFVGFFTKTRLFNKYREILSTYNDLYEER